MRRIITLLAGMLILTLVTTHSQANPTTPDLANFNVTVFDSLRVAAFTNTSILGSEPGERIGVWNFGDGNQATTGALANITHLYPHPGVYNACLRIYRRNNAGDTVLSAMFCKTVTIAQVCTANFERLLSNANPTFAYFRAFAWSNGNPRPLQVCWNFGDGHDTCINYPSNYTGLYQVGHQYANNGTYQVCVIIHYDGGCTATKCRSILIGNPPPPPATCEADFERIQTAANPLNNYFRALPSNSNNRKPSEICWRFGDGHDTCITYTENYTGQYAVNHIYNHPDNYEVCVRITYYGGCQAYKCRLIHVSGPDRCEANFEKIPSPNTMPLQVFLKALPSHNNNRKPSRICWNFGDGHDTCINYTENYTGQYLVSHRYAHPDSFNVCVSIRYYGGCEAQKCRRIYVPNPQPGCTVNMVTIVPSNYSLVRGFVATPYSFATPPARPLYICWRFGDGHDTCYTVDSTRPPGSNFAISHRYANAGVYNACVRVVFQGGCIAEQCKEVRIYPAPAAPRLRLAPNPVQQTLYVEFTSLYTEAVVIRIVNSNGIPVRTYTRSVNVGINTWPELVSNLPPGIYTYVVQSPRQFITEHFVKL